MAKAHDLAKRQREISIAEFFEKNRHLLGFDNKRKALLTTIKEAVDNSLDACEEGRILPEINVEINQLSDFKYGIVVEDNGPGILKSQIPKVFAKLLYGSKFFKLSQSLAGDEKIIARIDGTTKVLPIQLLIDSHISGEGEVDVDNVEVPAFDWKEHKYSFSKVSTLIKHKRQHDLYRISTANGNSVKVTGCHSLFAMDKSLNVREVEAKELKKGDFIVAPKSLHHEGSLSSISVLDHVSHEDVKGWSVYGFSREFVQRIVKEVVLVEKKTASGKRKFYRFKDVNGKLLDMAEEDVNLSQHVKKSSLPLIAVLKMGLSEEVRNCTVRTRRDCEKTEMPVSWDLKPQLMNFLGLYAAAGQADDGRVRFKFSKDCRHLAEEVLKFAVDMGMDAKIEEIAERRLFKVDVFGSVLSVTLQNLFGKRAHGRTIPDFVFETSKELRQSFIDAIYQSNGLNFRTETKMVHSTPSEQFAAQLSYLLLMNGITSSTETVQKRTADERRSKTFLISTPRSHLSVSKSFNKRESAFSDEKSVLLSEVFNRFMKDKSDCVPLEFLQKMRSADDFTGQQNSLESMDEDQIGGLVEKGYVVDTSSGFLFTKKAQDLHRLLQRLEVLMNSDICLLKVTGSERITEGHDYVYDISVPEKENFVASGLSCHNSRGQQGIGISAAVLYSQLTTGKPAKITSRISSKDQANYYELHIDVKKNAPEILKEEKVEWNKEHGTRIELTLEADYLKGHQSVDEYVRQTAIINPHVTLNYVNPKAESFVYNRGADKLPPLPKEIKPHPYGVEIGLLMRLLDHTAARTLHSFLMVEFSRVGPGTAKEICSNASLLTETKPRELTRDQAEKLIQSINKTKIITPPTDCISPIGEELLEKGLKKEVEAEFYCSTSRRAQVYRGNPFVVEAAIAYGGSIPKDKQISIMRFANRVPLLYQQGACATSDSLTSVNWKPYGLQQSGNSVPLGPAVIVIHMASVWVPFTSEAKEAIAHYPEIIKEIKFALQECGRKLGTYVNKKIRVTQQLERANLFEKYIPEVADSLAALTSVNKEEIVKSLNGMLNKDEIRKQLELDSPENEENEKKQINGKTD